MLRVAAYTGGKNVPGARFRLRQYIPALRELGVDVREYYALFNTFPPRSRMLRPIWGIASIAERCAASLASRFCDVTFLQREMISTLLTVETLTRKPRILDVDDAIFLNRGGDHIRRLAQLCDVVVCGNDYLAETFRAWNPNVELLPTGVDTDRFSPGPGGGEPLSIGWSGTSGGFSYLEMVSPALRTVLELHPTATLRIVAERRPELKDIPPERIVFIPWSEENEVSEIRRMTVGIMPLRDDLWSRGKCSFKLLTYLSCGIPVVASPVGMNAQVLAASGGLKAETEEEWVGALDGLLASESFRTTFRDRGRQAVLDRYSLRALLPKLLAILKSAAERG